MAITNADKQALLNGTATIPFKINIVKDGQVVKTLDEYSIVDLDYEDFRYVDTSSLVIGQFVARKITGNLDQIYSEFEIEDTELELQMGISYNGDTHYYSLGNFLVTKPSNDEVKDKTSFEAMDYAKKFNVVFDGSEMSYPCTALELATECCRQAGVELATTDFTNYNFEIPTNQYVEGDTCRKVMQDIGKLAYSWVRIDWDNKCYIDFEIQDTVEEYNTIDNTQYYDLSLQKTAFGPVNRVVIGMRDVEGENAVIEDSASIAEHGVTEIQLYDSNITYTPELRLQAIQQASKLFGLTYVPLEINTIGHPWLIGNEKIEIRDMNNNPIYTYPWDRTIAYSGHIKTKLTSKADSKTETEYRNYGDIESSVQRTRVVVDKQNQTITSLAENVSTYDSRITTVEQTVDSISSRVEDIFDAVRNATGYTVELNDCIAGALQGLTLYGNIKPLYPSTTIYPSTSLYALPGKYYIKQSYYEDSEEIERLYELPFTYLGYINESVHDDFVIDNQGNCKVIRNVGISNGEYYELSTPVEEDYGQLVIENVDGTNTYTFTPYFNAYFSIDYVIRNDITDIYATKVEVNSQIKQTRNEIELSVDQKTDTDNLIAKINLKPGNILLEGTITANNNFQILQDGSIIAKNGSFSGNIFLEDGGRVLGGDGLFSCLAYTSVGRFSNWEILGFHTTGANYTTEGVQYGDVFVNASIPENFTITSAYVVLEVTSVNSAYSNASGDYEVVGTPKQLALLKGAGGTTVEFFYYPYQAIYEDVEYSGDEIPNAFGNGRYTPTISSPGDVQEIKSKDIKDYLDVGEMNTIFVRSLLDPKPVIKHYALPYGTGNDYEELVRNTGVGRLNLFVFGYMSMPSEEE